MGFFFFIQLQHRDQKNERFLKYKNTQIKQHKRCVKNYWILGSKLVDLIQFASSNYFMDTLSDRVTVGLNELICFWPAFGFVHFLPSFLTSSPHPSIHSFLCSDGAVLSLRAAVCAGDGWRPQSFIMPRFATPPH